MVACNNDVLLNPSLNVLVNNNLSRECKIPCAVCQSHIMYSFTLQRAQGQKYKKKRLYAWRLQQTAKIQLRAVCFKPFMRLNEHIHTSYEQEILLAISGFLLRVMGKVSKIAVLFRRLALLIITIYLKVCLRACHIAEN